jgi:hypothetical protein
VSLIIIVALALLMTPIASAAAPSSEQSTLMRELHTCLRDLPSETTPERDSPCAQRSTSILVGIARTELLGGIGEPTFCLARSTFTPWRAPYCRGRVSLGYSFYRLRQDCVGCGPELLFEFDSEDRVKAVRWSSLTL